jgi:hypothetical protein
MRLDGQSFHPALWYDCFSGLITRAESNYEVIRAWLSAMMDPGMPEIDEDREIDGM